jgi:hypothetical protein
MRISELLTSLASWLDSPNNEAFILAQYDDACLKVVAESCAAAAAIIKDASEKVELLEPEAPSMITPESIDSLTDIATAFDASGDPELKRQAAVIDELIITFAASPTAFQEKQAETRRQIDELRQKYQDTKKRSDELHHVEEVKTAIKDSNATKTYNVMEAPLSARCCPDHPGEQMQKVNDSEWQCNLDKKTYDFANGFSLLNGSKVPGSVVENQAHNEHHDYRALFDTRDARLGNV